MTGRASLNHVYRTVWNQALGAMVAVAEIASSGGRAAPGSRSRRDGSTTALAPPLRTMSLSILLAFASFAAPAQTLPSGGAAVHGGATFNTSQPNRLTVTTTNGAGSNHSAINWNSFSIGSGNTTNFVQPNAGSLSINRVVTNTPSQLFGTLSSNGKLVLVNQSGIAVGAGAVVDTAGFTASALAMSEADAIAGRLRFGGGSSANLTVDGNIIARGGDVVLIAPNVDVAKTALVESQGGSVVLAAGQSVEVTGRGLEGITLQVQAPTDQAINLGTLKGDAVGIFAGTLRHSGMIQAVRADMEGGKVVLRAVGDAYMEGQGQINATSSAGKGGSVDVLGNRVAVMDDAVIDVSGARGGGNVRVGGDYQGGNPNIPNADISYFGPKASIKADATADGNGGRVIVWADDTTRAYGSISARGGAQGGDGGFVETSGHKYLDFQGFVDTLAPMGAAGTLLLDPQNIEIGSLSDVFSGGTNPSTGIFQGAFGNSQLTWATINSRLGNGNLEIRTNSLSSIGGVGKIDVISSTTLLGNVGSLTMLATENINFLSGVSVSAAVDMTLVAGWNNTGQAVNHGLGTIDFAANSSLLTTGNLTFNAGNSVTQSPSASLAANVLTVLTGTGVATPTGGINLPGTANSVNRLAVQMNNPTATLGLTFVNTKPLTLGAGAFGINGIVATGNPNSISITTTGPLTVASPVSSGGDVNLTGNTGITLASNVATTGTVNLDSSAGNGNITQTSASALTGGLDVKSGSGNITLNSVNAISTFSATSSGAVSVTNGATPVDLFGITAGSLLFVSAADILSCCTPITTTVGGVEFRTTGGVINLNTDAPSDIVSAAGIKLLASGNLDLFNVSLTTNAGGDLVLASSGGNLFATGVSVTNNGGGRWLTYLTNPSAGHTFGPFDPISNANFRQVNSTYGTPSATPAVANANGSLWADSGLIVGSLSGTVTKVFAGVSDTSISMAGSNFTPLASGSGLLFGETVAPISLAGSSGSLLAPVSASNSLQQVTFAAGQLPGIVGGGKTTYGYNHGTLSALIGNVTQAPVTVTPTTVSPISLFGTRAYDGTVIVNANIFTLSGLQGGDTLSLSGFGLLADKNVGTNKAVNLNTLALGNGTGLASNYTFAGGTFFASITPAPLSGSLNVTAANKVYDGLTVATLAGSASGLGGVIAGDVVTVAGVSGDFSDRHVGKGKRITVNGVVLGGADAGNYTFAGAAGSTTTADITQRPTSTWTGAGGNTQWSNPANWDALPDRNNVAAVSIPAGAGQVTFDAGVDATTLQSLTSGQTLAMTGSSLLVNADLNLPGFSQTGGTLKGAGGLNVSSNFNQTGGSLQFARDVSINQASGNLVMGDLAARRVELKAPAGSINQTAGLDTPTLVAEAATGMALTSNTNKIGSVRLTNTGTGNISLVNTGALDIAGLRNAGGDVTVVNTGATNTSGLVNVPKGDVNITANSPLRIGNDGIAAGGDVTLIASNLTSLGNMVIDGPIASGGAVSMTAGNNFTQNAAIFGADGVTATAQGAFSYGPLAFTSRAPVSYTSNGVRVVPPPDPRAVKRGESPDAVVAFLDQFGRAQRRQILDTLELNADGTPVKRRDRDAVQTEGNVCAR
jgi:filamentous hemagglutinin family protein